MLKKFGIVVLLLVIFLLLVKRKNMSWKQSVVRAIYPLFVLKDKWFKKPSFQQTNTTQQQPLVSFYSLQAKNNKGELVDFSAFQGKQVLIVNTASDCGYTPQYEELESIHQQYKDLVILAFPANDFKEQEKKGDAEIEQFCKMQHPVFRWLSDTTQNGWCKRAPVWNFSKYLINKEGVLTHYFAPQVQPLSPEFQAALK